MRNLKEQRAREGLKKLFRKILRKSPFLKKKVLVEIKPRICYLTLVGKNQKPLKALGRGARRIIWKDSISLFPAS